MWKLAIIATAVSCLYVATPSQATTQNARQPEPKTLETVVVTGTLPGPSLWQVKNGENVLWLMGTVSPLPKNMVWDSAEVEEILTQSDEVIAPGGTEAEISTTDLFKMALLARSANAAIKLPDGHELRDILPGPVHERWSALRQKYLANNKKVEHSRPMFASQDLYFGAISASGMTRANVVWDRIAEIARVHGISVTQTVVKFPLAIDRQAYKAGIAALAASQVNDLDCFSRTIDTLEADLDVMKRGANAWAVGDLDLLRLIKHNEVKPACKQTYDAAMGFQRRPGISGRVSTAWLTAAERALRINKVTFAVLPIEQMTSVDGLVDQLKAMGFVVIEPNAP